MQQVIADLETANIGEIRVNEPLSKHTTWRIGGPADVMILPSSKKEVVAAVRKLHELGTPWTVIGRGSNLLVTDKGIRGAVIKLGSSMDTISFGEEQVTAGGSFSLTRLTMLAAREGYTGLEFAGGIPASVGGAVYMNAGAHGSDVSRILKQAEVVLETGELVTFQAKDLQYSYRHSLLHDHKGIVTEAVFQLKRGDHKEIAAELTSYKDRRLKSQPLKSACAGSVFRNPDGHYAAALIEKAGLKGLRSGGAEVSTLHANFIVNTGNATASDVLALMEQIRKTVFEKNGVELVPEVYVVGER